MIATVESTVPLAAVKQPPSVRDFAIYRFVKFECNSTREAGFEYELSQTRVRQVIARVLEFMIESAPAGTDEESSDERLYVAEQLAYERLEYLYQRAIKGFDDTHREDVHGNLLPGKVSYLAVAARITLWMAKVPVHPLPAFREDSEDDQIEPDALPMAMPATRSSGQNPPVADCSLPEVSRGQIPASIPQARVESAIAETSCKTLEEIKAEARRKFLRPAQAAARQSTESPARGDGESPAKESPAADPLYARMPLNRRERRARERARKRTMAKR